MPTEQAEDSHFWDRYIEILRLAAVPEKARRWYVVRIELYLDAHPEAPAIHTKDIVHGHLSQAGRDTKMQGWLFRQLVHALQLLFTRHLGASRATDLDWQ